MATLKITTLTAGPPVRLQLTLNGQGYSLEYPDKQAALDALQTNIQDPEVMVELALLLVLREWRKTDPNLTNLAGLKNKNCTITVGVAIA